MSIRAPWKIIAIVGACSLAMDTPKPVAFAQNALGDGQALDANPLVGSGGRNQRGRDIARELRFRNAIVTGNVAGGFGFRGDLGYTAADDFRDDDGTVGSNDLFDFQRDSAFSAVGVRGVAALRYQMGLATGGQYDSTLGLPIFRRAGAGETPVKLRADALRKEELDMGDFGYDAFSIRPGVLRSASGHLTTTTLSPRVLGEGQSRETKETTYFLESSLRGVWSQEASDYVRPFSPNLRTGNPIKGIVNNKNELAPAGAVRATYEDVYEQLRNAFGTGEQDDAQEGRDKPSNLIDGALNHEVDNKIDNRVKNEAPTGTLNPVSALTGATGLDQSSLEFQRRLQAVAEQLNLPTRATAQDDRAMLDPGSQAREKLLNEVGEVIGSMQPRIETFIDDEDASKSVFARHMREGQEKLAANRYLDAEERFTSAMRVRVGDPMAAIGRVNAQLGAAMFRSASLNLQQLFRTNPELMGVRYAEDLLPAPRRLVQVKELLSERAERNTEFGRAAALMLGYLEYQTENIPGVRQAQEMMERISEELDDSPDVLYEALFRVWLSH